MRFNSRAIAHRQGRIAAVGTDYLLHSLIDAVVDNYLAVLELMGEQLDSSSMARSPLEDSTERFTPDSSLMSFPFHPYRLLQ